MGAPTARPRVLVIGLDPYRVPGPWDPAPVAAAIEAATARLAGHGVDVVNCLLGLDGSDDVEAVVTAAVRDGVWDVVLVGGGIREPADLLDEFETVVNVVHRHAPGATIAFNRTRSDIIEAVLRRLR